MTQHQRMYFLTVEPKKRLTQMLRNLPPGCYEEYDVSLGKVLVVMSMNSISISPKFLLEEEVHFLEQGNVSG